MHFTTCTFDDRKVVGHAASRFRLHRRLGALRQGSFQPAAGRSLANQAHSCLRFEQLAARHPRVGQRKLNRPVF